MAAEQREPERGQPTWRDRAWACPSSAKTALWALALWFAFASIALAQDIVRESVLSPGATAPAPQNRTEKHGHSLPRDAKPAAKTPRSHVPRSSDWVRLPGHTRSDTGRIAEPSALHGDAQISAASATLPTDERAVLPIPAANALEPPPLVDPTQPSPFQDPQPPVERPVSQAPSDVPESAPAAGAKPVQPASAPFPGMTPTGPAEPPAGKSESRTDTPHTGPLAGEIAESQPSQAEGQVVLDETVLEQIRREIKSRLVYFQACADAARRRGGLELHRLQATWFIAANGAIKQLKIDGVPDTQLTTCLTRVGSRPFAMPPGMDLTIPTPIVFVR